MNDNIKKIDDLTIRVVNIDNKNDDISPEDKDMDKRAVAAVKSAINKAKVCNKPIAKYDIRRKKAYIEQSDGERKYVE